MDRYSSEHRIDETRWPHLFEVPEARFLSKRSLDFSERLERLLSLNDVAFHVQDGGKYLEVRDGMMLDRAIADGWLGLGESFLNGEWTAEPLPEVLSVLLQQPLESKKGYLLGGIASGRTRHNFGKQRPGELPDGLVELYAGQARATGSALFSSARSTATVVIDPLNRGNHDVYKNSTELAMSPKNLVTKVKSAFMKPQPGRGALWPIDETWFEAPEVVGWPDLDAAQIRRIELMLEEAGVGAGDRVLELPGSGGQLAIQAARRGASVDVLTPDADQAASIEARAYQAGVAGGIRVELIDGLVPTPRQWAGRYDVIFSVERMEVLGQRGLSRFLQTLDRLLAAGGVAVVQTVVATEQQRPWVAESLDLIRAYIWPELRYSSVSEVRAATAKQTHLQIVAETHLGEHLAATLPLWRSQFLANQRQAAAAGFDIVYRRLWNFQFALHEALLDSDDVDCVQFVFEAR